VRNFTELGALHTVCDPAPEKPEDYKSLYPEVRTSVDYQQVVADQPIRGVVHEECLAAMSLKLAENPQKEGHILCADRLTT